MKSIIELVKTTWELYRSHVGLFIGYSAWLLIPMIINVLLTITFGSDYADIITTVVLTLDLLMVIWVMASIIQVTALVQANKRIDARKISSYSWGVSVSLLLLSIILSIITGLGLLLLIVPGVAFTVYATFSSVILVLERKSIKEAIRASFELVKGRFWKILGRLFAGNIIIFIPYAAAMLIIAGLLLMLSGGSVDALISNPATLMEQIMLRVIDVFFIPVFIIFGVTFYKNAKETRS
ncbi:hypothetical protein HN358_02395 [Candidatus Uhrbacteria bacterium]|nr:hypothetical protein [Candidatus Uhrbacteria bacterium]MBT7717529.1 hypothetical protein [Candidatus Uhrbacteria bacterium]